jgi:hypothetical protein
LVFSGEDLWRELLGLVKEYLPSYAVEAKASAPEVCEEEEEEIAALGEVAERYYGSLDLSGGLSEEVEVPDWPEGWDEERI